MKIQHSDIISNVYVRHRCCNIEPTVTIVKHRRLRWLGHVLIRPIDRVIKQVLLPAPLPDLQRRPGGRLKNWWATVQTTSIP